MSAHADQVALKSWYANFNGRPPVSPVHGEKHSINGLSSCLRHGLSASVHIARPGEVLETDQGEQETWFLRNHGVRIK